MMDKTKMIVVMRQESLWVSICRDAGAFALFGALIGLGVFVDSPAMQWAGFVIGTITILGYASRATTRFTVEGAKAEIDRIEAEQAAT